MDKRLLVLALATFAIGTDNYVVAGILPQVARSFDVSIAAAGQFVTAYSLTYAVCTPIVATLTANWPRRRVLLVGLVVFVVGNLLTATQSTFMLALASRAVAGLGGAMVTPAASAAATALVSAEHRGRALAVVLAGLSGATALGAPIGTVVASFGEWRSTMWFVAGFGTLSWIGISRMLPDVQAPPPLRLRDRLSPLGDARAAVTLATTFVVMLGIFMIYTYVSVVFDRATGGEGVRLAALLSIWGIGATVGILVSGKVTDRFGSRRVVDVVVPVTALDFALIHWTSAHFTSAAVALAIWGLCGWAFVVAQQHRLVGIAPSLAPILLALNATAIYLAVSVSGALGALATLVLDPHDMPFLGAILIACGLPGAELAHRLVTGHQSIVRVRQSSAST